MGSHDYDDFGENFSTIIKAVSLLFIWLLFLIYTSPKFQSSVSVGIANIPMGRSCAIEGRRVVSIVWILSMLQDILLHLG